MIVEYAAKGNLKDYLRKQRPVDDSLSPYVIDSGQPSDIKRLTLVDFINYALQVWIHDFVLNILNPISITRSLKGWNICRQSVASIET